MLAITANASFGNKLIVQNATLQLGALAVTAASFEEDGGTIDGSGTLTITGAATFTNASNVSLESGTGTTLLKGTTTFSTAYLYLQGGRVLENQGTLNWTEGTFDLGQTPLSQLHGTGTIKNDSGAIFDIQSKTASFGTTHIGATFTNTGTVSVQTGTLEFDGGGTAAASAFTVASIGSLAFGGGAFTLSAGTYNAAGRMTVVSGGKVDFSAVTAITSFGSQLLVTGGTLELGSNTASTASLEQDAGTIDGTGTLTVTGSAMLATESSDAVQMGAGTTVLQGTTTVSGSVALDDGRVLENAGTLNLTAGNFYVGQDAHGNIIGGATVNNDSGATFDIQDDAALDSVSFSNTGTLEKTIATGVTNLGDTFTNGAGGIVSVLTGTLEFDDMSTFGGTVNGSGSVLIDFASTFSNLMVGGTVTVTNNSTVTETGAVTIGDSAGGAKFVNASGRPTTSPATSASRRARVPGRCSPTREPLRKRPERGSAMSASPKITTSSSPSPFNKSS